MDLVRFSGPAWLLAAPVAWAAILVFALAARPRRPGAPARATVACLAAGLLAAALAGPDLKVSRRGPCPVWILQDVSPSMRPAAGASADDDALAPYAAAVPSGSPVRLRFPQAGDSTGRDGASPGAAGTDIEQALQGAAAAAGDCGLLVLYTDARETEGDAVRAAASLAARGLRVYAALPRLAPRDVRVAGLSAPARVPLGASVPLRVRLASTVQARATVQLARAAGSAAEGVGAAEIPVDPAAGAEALFQDAPPAPALYTYYVQIRSSDDDWPENDRASCLVRVGEGFDVAYVYGGERPGDTLRRLRAGAPAGVRFRSVAAGQFTSPLAGETAVVLDNVAAWALGPEAAADLARRVTGGGLGLLALGGDRAFGAGGYGDSPLEDVLPVSSRTAARPPLDLVFVIDASGSMNEMADGVAKIAAAKFAVLDLRSALAPADRVGVVAFAGEPRAAAPLAPASDWEGLGRRLVEIEAGGGTRITPAVTAAIGLFGPTDAGGRRLRHVILLSDGRSADFDLAGLAAACRNADVSLSAVATGPDADRDRLARLAQETGGRLYAAAGAARRPLREAFLADMAWKRGEGLRPGARAAAWLAAEPIWREGGPPLPAVDALNLTQPKPAADLLWAAAPAPGQPPAPLLAAWRRGLGKVAAMPWPVSDASGKWSEGDALGGYLAAVLAWLCQPSEPRDWSARLVQRGSEWRVRVEETCAALGKSLPPPAATAWAEGGAGPHPVGLEQVAPGVYEGKVGDAGGGATLVVVRRPAGAGAQAAPAGGGAAAAGAEAAAGGGAAAAGAEAAAPLAEETVQLAVPGLPPPEYEHLGVDRDRLGQIVRAGGGSILDSPDALADAVRQMRAQGYVPVGLYFVLAAGAVLLAQVALRMAGKL